MNIYRCVRFVSLAVAVFATTNLASGQTANLQRRITQPIDEKSLTVLHGNTHPMAQARFDRGEAPADLPMDRMLLVLKHSDAQETALKNLLMEQQVQDSANFHHWLTPEEFGTQFGPSEADVQAVTAWLGSHGFTVQRVSNGRHVIEFSGSALQVQSTFHTAIHKYQVNGKDHWANNADPQIPTALASVVAGVKSLHNFRARPASHLSGTFRRDNRTGQTMKLSAGSTPSFTFPTGCTGPDCLFGLGPTDFATIYNVTPLWKNGIDGTGQTIAIVQDSNIDIQDVRNFRKLFNLPQNDPEIVLDGPDPGLDPDEDEAVLDVEWSGAVAKGAKIKLVVSSGTNTTAGTDLSALYIVDNNISPVMSESFLECELHLGTAGNQFENALWQQAAAEGITAFVASGDGGSAGCDNFNTATVATEGLAVNGLSSTPYNVAVGGTDLLAAVINPTQFFSLTNDPKTQASALSYVPETPWNDSCASALFGSDGVADCNDPTIVPDFLDIVGGSGGVSSCTVSDGENASTCGKSGYPKPVWQTGVGVPKDGKRDIPDVSLFAGNGFLGAFYIFCEADALPSNPTCALDPTSTTDFLGAGGTSFASPNFAGIMAMVNQKTNTRQGNANFVFYRLAANETLANCNSTGASLPASNCIFNDVTFGNNVVPCAAGSPNCTTNGQNVPNGILSGFNAGVGYDLASGLGTVNAANLVNNWRSITFTPTTTTLNLHPTTIMHGQAIRVDVAVNAKGGTPTGQVAIKTDAKNPVGDLTLDKNGDIDAAVRNFPGGSWTVQARYGGDPMFAHSESNTETIKVSPEPSNTTLSLFTLNLMTGATPPFTGGSYGSIVFVRADVAGQSGFGVATGNVNITDNGRSVPPGNPFTLNAQGNTLTPNSINTFSVGTHTIKAQYHGDASFNASTANPITFVITKATTQTSLAAKPLVTVKNALVTLNVSIVTNSFGDQPTGTVTFFDGGNSLGTVNIAAATDPNTGLVSATASLMTSKLPNGANHLTARYSGDSNYVKSTSTAVTVKVN